MEVTNRLSVMREYNDRGARVSPGGVHGAGRFVDPVPTYFHSAEGAYIEDVTGEKYIDYHGGYGTAALGYNDPTVRAAVVETLNNQGVLFAAPHLREMELAETLIDLIPSAEMVAFCGGGGSDPLYFGYRLARAVTGRRKLLKFEGEYHGWHDPLAVSVRPERWRAGPSSSPQAVPVSAGAAESSASAVVGSLNDTDLLERLFAQHGHELACAVIEPICHSSGVIPLEDAFITRLRALCSDFGVVLMFDEVMSGFRHNIGGAQSLVGVTPDLSAFAKAMANGYPMAALVGRRELMAQLSPTGPAFYSGTYGGNLVGIAAAQATIKVMKERQVHQKMGALSNRLAKSVNSAFAEHKSPGLCRAFGGMAAIYFGLSEVKSYRDLLAQPALQVSNINALFQAYLQAAGIYLQPYPVNRLFISAAHTEAEISKTEEVVAAFVAEHSEAIQGLVSESGA